jgi:hypothetical protein
MYGRVIAVVISEGRREKEVDVKRRKHENVIKFDVYTHPVAFERKIMLFVFIITSCVVSLSLFYAVLCDDGENTKRHLSPGRLMTHSLNGLV